MKKVRLADIAHAAGVSPAAASMALSGKGRLSSGVRAKVLEAASGLGYRRPVDVRVKVPFRHIVVLHHADRPYEWDFIRPFFTAIEEEFIPKGFVPVIFPVLPGTGEDRLYERISGIDAGAVFSIHYSNETLFLRLENSGIRVIVLIDGSLQEKFDTVCADDFRGAYEGTKHLLELGHREILYVEYGRPENPSILADRFVGFRKALEETGIPFPSERRITVPFADMRAVEDLARRVFVGVRQPTAVFAHDDYLAAFILTALRELNIPVPGRVSIIAPGDILDYGQPFIPRITTMRIDTVLMSRQACGLMLDRLSTERPGIQTLKVRQQPTDRGSCRNLRA